MTRLFALFILLCSPAALFAFGTDSAAPPEHRFSLTLQVGQPNHIVGADVLDGDQPFNTLHGDLSRFSMGAGGIFRYHVDESFFLQARVMYSTRRYTLYDSTMDEPVIDTFPQRIMTTNRTYVTDNNYFMSNMLFGIGGGHEGHYGRFIVRAGGEIDFIRYADVLVETATRNYTFKHSDSISGGTHDKVNTQTFHDLTTSPGLWAIGIMGHASLEYKLNPSFGIGASLYLGGFFCGGSEKLWYQEGENVQTITDSSAPTTITEDDYYNEFEFSVRQFDFAPLNAQINFAYYFGTL